MALRKAKVGLALLLVTILAAGAGVLLYPVRTE